MLSEWLTQSTLALVVSLLIFGGAAVLALAWAVREGQFANFQRAAEAIFDDDEPIGMPTDRTLAKPSSAHSDADGVVDG